MRLRLNIVYGKCKFKENESFVAVINLKFIPTTTETTETTNGISRSPIRKLTACLGSSGSSGSSDTFLEKENDSLELNFEESGI